MTLIRQNSEFSVKQPSSPWLRPIRTNSATYFVAIGRIHGEPGRFTSNSAETKWVR